MAIGVLDFKIISVSDIPCYESKLHNIWKNTDKQRSPKEHLVTPEYSVLNNNNKNNNNNSNT